MSKITNIRKNRVGTTSFDLIIQGMRKPQDFLTYAISHGDTYVKIQSDKRIGRIDLATGKGQMSQNHPNGAYGIHLATDQLINFELSSEDFESLKEVIRSTAGKLVGEYLLVNNEGAATI